MKAVLHDRRTLKIRGDNERRKEFVTIACGLWNSRFTIVSRDERTITMTDDFQPGVTVSVGIRQPQKSIG